ncbi:MAG: hypothetical protein WBZ36_07825 [Candidatus Nitrosopolaris sp.]
MTTSFAVSILSSLTSFYQPRLVAEGVVAAVTVRQYVFLVIDVATVGVGWIATIITVAAVGIATCAYANAWFPNKNTIATIPMILNTKLNLFIIL